MQTATRMDGGLMSEGEIHPGCLTETLKYVILQMIERRVRLSTGLSPHIFLHQSIARRRRTSRGGVRPRPSSPAHLQLLTVTDGAQTGAESRTRLVSGGAPPVSRHNLQEKRPC